MAWVLCLVICLNGFSQKRIRTCIGRDAKWALKFDHLEGINSRALALTTSYVNINLQKLCQNISFIKNSENSLFDCQLWKKWYSKEKKFPHLGIYLPSMILFKSLLMLLPHPIQAFLYAYYISLPLSKLIPIIETYDRNNENYNDSHHYIIELLKIWHDQSDYYSGSKLPDLMFLLIHL